MTIGSRVESVKNLLFQCQLKKCETVSLSYARRNQNSKDQNVTFFLRFWFRRLGSSMTWSIGIGNQPITKLIPNPFRTEKQDSLSPFRTEANLPFLLTSYWFTLGQKVIFWFWLQLRFASVNQALLCSSNEEKRVTSWKFKCGLGINWNSGTQRLDIPVWMFWLTEASKHLFLTIQSGIVSVQIKIIV